MQGNCIGGHEFSCPLRPGPDTQTQVLKCLSGRTVDVERRTMFTGL